MDESGITLTESDSERVVTVALGTELIVDLEENATTGFRWSLEPVGHDSDGVEVVEVVDERFVSPSELVPGAAGRRTWRLATPTAGTTPLRFTLRQPWERAAPAANEVSFTVEVVDHQT